jgi:endonuclease-3
MSEASDSARKKHAATILRGLRRAYPDVRCALRHDNPFQLLVATILSAQCTDQRVNMVVPELFRRYPTPASLAAADRRDLEGVIQSTGFFRTKAKNIQAVSRVLAADHAGEVPRDLEQLVKLPGVGRKTANVVLGTAFGLATGVVVDTHVQRISRRLGLTEERLPAKIEQDLMHLLPRKEWIDYSHRVIHHGRQVCKARRPRCDECPLAAACPRVGVSLS